MAAECVSSDSQVLNANEIKDMQDDARQMQSSSRLLSQVKGFLDDAEGQALYRYAYEAALHGPCLEIGSYCGKSAIYS